MLRNLFAGRAGYLLGALISFGVVGYALYIQSRDLLEPCPLCIFQRIAFMVLGGAFLLAVVHNPTGLWRKLHGALEFIIAAVGSSIAMRHIWIQRNPDKVLSECGAGFDYLFESFPFSKALQLIFQGTGECASKDWTLLGFTIPELSLAAFVMLGGYAVVLIFVKKA